jgi:hypothetical protein
MNRDHAKGRPSKATGQVDEVISNAVVVRLPERRAKVQKISGKTKAANCDFSSELQQLWMVF